jgi:hypothetical protein
MLPISVFFRRVPNTTAGTEAPIDGDPNLERVEPTEEPRKLCCDFCEQVFSKPQPLSRHRNEHHAAEIEARLRTADRITNNPDVQAALAEVNNAQAEDAQRSTRPLAQRPAGGLSRGPGRRGAKSRTAYTYTKKVCQVASPFFTICDP